MGDDDSEQGFRRWGREDVRGTTTELDERLCERGERPEEVGEGAEDCMDDVDDSRAQLAAGAIHIDEGRACLGWVG